MKQYTLTLAFLILAVLLVAPSFYGEGDSDEAPPSNISSTSTYEVLYVLDGDSFVVREGSATSGVRMLGIDAPETNGPRPDECFAAGSAEYLRELLEGKRVRLMADPTQARRDTYDRLLSYVYLPDGRMVNELLLSGGYAREYTHIHPYEKRAAFLRLQEDARAARRGLWVRCNGEKTP